MIWIASSPTTSRRWSDPESDPIRSPVTMSASPLRPVLFPLLGLLLSAPVASAILLAQAAPSPAQSSAYTLAGIDIFGNTKTPDAAILGVLSIKQGAEINPAVVTALDEKLRASGKFAFSRISSTGYGDHKSYLTVDVVEKGEEKRLQLNPAPRGSVSVPLDILDWFRRYEKASYEFFQVNTRRLRSLDA